MIHARVVVNRECFNFILFFEIVKRECCC